MYGTVLEGKVWEKKRALYELKKVSRAWYEEPEKNLGGCGFPKSEAAA